MKKFKFLLLILISLFIIPYNVNAQEEQKDEPVAVISNITSVSFTVSWFTRNKEEQAVIYGTAEPLSLWALDDRGPFVKRGTHHVTLKNLQPNTEYLFKIGPEGKTYKQKTAQLLNGVLPPLSETFKGIVKTEDKVVPNEAIIYMKLENANVLSTTADDAGNWQIRTATMRTADLSSYKKVIETNYIDLYARSGSQGDVLAKTYALERVNPINLILEEPRIPFYKVKLPADIFYPAQAISTESSNPVEATQSASTENFFQVIWKRVKEIF